MISVVLDYRFKYEFSLEKLSLITDSAPSDSVSTASDVSDGGNEQVLISGL